MGAVRHFEATASKGVSPHFWKVQGQVYPAVEVIPKVYLNVTAMREYDFLSVCWEGFRESRRCSGDTYPESYITEYTSCTKNIVSRAVASHRRPRGAPSDTFETQTSQPHAHPYKGTSLIRNSSPLGPYRKTMPRALQWS